MRQEHSVVIQRPVSDVFAYVDEPENAPKWAEGIERLETLDEKPGVVGTTFRMHIREGGKVNVYEGIATAWEKDRLTRDSISRGGMSMEMEMRYEPAEGGKATRVTQTVDVPLKGAIALMAPLIWLMNRHFQRKQLGKLKELLEHSAGAAV